MFLIRPKPKVPFKRTHLFSLSDLLKVILATPFIFLAAIVEKVFEEVMVLILLFVPMLAFAYMATDGSILQIFQFFKDNWRFPVSIIIVMISFARVFRAIDGLNKTHK